MATDSTGRPPLIIDATPDAAADTVNAEARDDYSLLAAAAGVGGVIGLAAALTLASLGLWPGSAHDSDGQLQAERTKTTQLLARLDEATRRLDAAAKTPAAASAAVDPRALAAVEASVKALEARIAKLEPLTDSVARLGKTTDDLAARAAAPGTSVPDASAPMTVTDPVLARRLDDAGRKLDTLLDLPARLAALATRIDALSTAANDIGSTRSDLDALRRDVDATRASLTELGTVPGLLASLATRTTALDASLKAQDARFAGVAAARSDAVLALALSNLKAAIDVGRPYASELAVATRIAGNSTDLSPLAAGAANGIPTLAALNARLPDITLRILNADKAPASGTLMDRFIAHAGQSVTVRRLGDPAGDSLSSRLSALQGALEKGDAAKASAAWGALPDSARAQAPDFGPALAARAAADAALDRVAKAALDRLSAPSQ